MGKKEERQQELVRILKNQNGIAINELSEMLNVSSMTIRRDIELLKEKHILLDVPGVAVLNLPYHENDDVYDLSRESGYYVVEKERIGQFAASLLEDGDSIIIDNGSTVEFLARAIDRNISLSLFTCGLNVANRVCNNPKINLMFGGGNYHSDTMMFEAPETVAMMHSFRATKVFSSAAGVHKELGVTCVGQYEIDIKRTIIHSGVEKILLVDSSKFGMVRPYYVTEMESYDRIISDTGLSQEWIDYIAEKGIHLDLV